MDEVKHKAAVDALNDLILSELQRDSRHRFASVKRLSVIAQRLLIECAPRPEDATVPEIGDYDGEGMMAPRLHGDFIGAGNDQAQMVREMVGIFSPAMRAQETSNRAKERETTARELNEVLDARERLQDEERAPVTARINEILKEMSQDDGLSLVPAGDERRHQVGAIVVRGDAGHPERALPDSAGSRESALQAGDEDRPAREDVVDGRELGERRPRFHDGADGDAERADLEGAGRPSDEPQAAPEATVGGALHERAVGTGDGGDASDDRRPSDPWGNRLSYWD